MNNFDKLFNKGLTYAIELVGSSGKSIIENIDKHS